MHAIQYVKRSSLECSCEGESGREIECGCELYGL